MAGLISFLGRSVKELVEMGFPEPVAKRISSGELPMDEASRMARAKEQGFEPELYYHSGSPDIGSLDTSTSSSKKTADTGTWFTDSSEVANTYLPPEGAMYPVRLKPGDYDKVDAGGQTWNWIENPEKTKVVSTDDLARAARTKAGSKGLIIDNVVDMGTNHPALNEAVDDKIDWILNYQENGARNVAVNDPTTVRSVNAAFDPEYTGSSLLGSRPLPTATTGLMGLDEIQAGNAQVELDSLMSQYNDYMDRKPDIYNYGELAPVKRNVVSGDYSMATPLLIDEIVKGLLDVGQSRKTGRVNNANSLWDVLL